MQKEIFSSITPAVFFGQLFQSRDIIHLTHLQTKGFAEHKALNEYYDSILGLTDELIEVYQGAVGKRINIKIPPSEYMAADIHLKDLRNYIGKHRASLFDKMSHVQNIVDEVVALIDKTLYLLTLS